MDPLSWQAVALCAVAGATAVGLAAVRVWHGRQARDRQALPDPGPDERAARLLGDTLRRSGGLLKPETADAVIAAYFRLAGDERRMLAALVAGLVGETHAFAYAGDTAESMNAKLLAVVRGADRPDATPSG